MQRRDGRRSSSDGCARGALEFTSVNVPVTVLVNGRTQVSPDVLLRQANEQLRQHAGAARAVPEATGHRLPQARGARRTTPEVAAAKPRASGGGPGRYLPDLVIVFPLQGSRVIPAHKLSPLLQDVLVLDDGVDDDGAADDDVYDELKKLRARCTDVTLQEVREALLADLKRYLAKQYCSMQSFQSRDDDEHFLLISLGDPLLKAQDDEVAKTFAHDKSYSFQTNFTATNANKKLKVKQSMRSELDATYLEFDRDVVQDAEAVFGLFKHEGSNSTSSSLFKEYSDGLAGTSGSFMRTVDRVRLLVASLEQLFDLEDCQGQGVISTYYAVHKASKLHEFRWGQQPSRADFRTGHVPWANFRIGETLRGILPQYGPPVQEIRDYFGEVIGFYFAWLHYTTMAIAWVLPFAVCFDALTQIADERETPDERRMVAAIYLGSAVCLSVWSDLYLKGWARRANHYQELWGLSNLDPGDVKRPDYRGDPKPNPVNENVLTKIYNPWFQRGVECIAISVTAFFLVIVLATVRLIYHHEETLGKFVASNLLSVQIFLCQIVWDFVSIKLVDVLNPRTDNEAKNLHVLVLFPISLVSAYTNIFMNWWTDQSCWDDREVDCTRPMRVDLYVVVLPVLFAQVPSMLTPYIIYRLKLWMESRQLRKTGGNEVRIGFLEAQAKQPQFLLIDHLNSEMNQMAILLGYVMLFGCVAPGITAAVCLTFAVKIRIDAFKLCNVYQRVMPSRQVLDGIGAWNQVLHLLVDLGRATSLAIPILNLGYFNSSPEEEPLLGLLGAGPDGLTFLQKVVLWFVCKEFLERIGKLIDYFADDVSNETKLLVARRKKVTTTMKMILSKGMRMRKESSGQSRRPSNQLNGPPKLNPRACELFQTAGAGSHNHLVVEEFPGEVEHDADGGHLFPNSR